MCLDFRGMNQIGRYNVAGGQFNSIGMFDLNGRWTNPSGNSSIGSGFDVPTSLPLTGTPTIQSGQTWHFQLWHRDTGTPMAPQNFSNGWSVMF